MVSLRSLADARLIRELSAQSEDVVILGGGFIGLEIAATLKAAGRKVTVVEAVDRLLGRAVAPVIASHVRQRLEASGVRILTGTTIARLEGENGHVSAAVTSTGERLPAQMVIIGIGVVPNVELARSRRHHRSPTAFASTSRCAARRRKSSPSATPPLTGTGSPAATCG